MPGGDPIESDTRKTGEKLESIPSKKRRKFVVRANEFIDDHQPPNETMLPYPNS
jgi:hypothetical protein